MSFEREELTPELIELARRMGDRLAEHGLLSATWQSDYGFTAFLAEKLPFYPGARLLIYPMAGVRPGRTAERYVIEFREHLYILAGGLEPIARANEEIPLSLTRLAVPDYVRFYLDHVKDKAGGIRLVEIPRQIPWIETEGQYQAPQVEKLIRPLRLLDTEDDGFLLMGTGLYEDALFRITFKVEFNGILHIEDEEQVAGELNIRSAANDGGSLHRHRR
jgi:hypothetical protein